jgi:hypothetical protein
VIVAGIGKQPQSSHTKLHHGREALEQQLHGVYEEMTCDELLLENDKDLFGVGIMLKAGPMGYPQIAGVRAGSAAEAGGVSQRCFFIVCNVIIDICIIILPQVIAQQCAGDTTLLYSVNGTHLQGKPPFFSTRNLICIARHIQHYRLFAARSQSLHSNIQVLRFILLKNSSWAVVVPACLWASSICSKTRLFAPI